MPSRHSNDCVSLKGYKPLVHIEKGLVLYHKGQLWLYQNDVLTPSIRLHTLSWKDCCRPAARLFRRDPKLACAIGKNAFLMAWDKKVLYVDLETQTIQCVHTARVHFSDPLGICPGAGELLAVWGDYGSNPEREAVHIYGLTKEKSVRIMYSFQPGTIRHIHTIIPKLQDGFYILTGDTEQTAGIYESDALFQNVRPVLTGTQHGRAVIAFDTPCGLLYATDAVNERNHIFLLKSPSESSVLTEINGSCIYGTKYADGYLFSTTVEPDESSVGLLSWFSYRTGAGILSREVHLVFVDKSFAVHKLRTYHKDFYPMKLMQYGSIQFSQENRDEVWIYPTAVRKFDGTAILLNGGNDREK